jgi:predicted ester cyclase
MKKSIKFLWLMAVFTTGLSCKDATNTTSRTPKEVAATDNSVRNKATFIKVNALYNEHKLDEAAQYYAPNFVRNGNTNATGPTTIKSLWEETYKSWPDHKGNIEQIIAEGDWVMLRGKATATHTQEVMGVKPTHKKMQATFWESLRFDNDGKIIESWSTLDNFAVMQQLGLIPTPK